MCDTDDDDDDDDDDLSSNREKKERQKKAKHCWQVSTGVCLDYHHQTNVNTISLFIISKSLDFFFFFLFVSLSQ
jgi:hypothetical protein